MITSYVANSRKILRAINFAVFEDFTAISKINSSKSYYTTDSYDSLADSQNLIHEIYHGEITLKIFSIENYPLLYSTLYVLLDNDRSIRVYQSFVAIATFQNILYYAGIMLDAFSDRMCRPTPGVKWRCSRG